MEKSNKWSEVRGNLMYALFALVLLFIILFSMVHYMYDHSEKGALESLRVQTEFIKDDINLQMLSDRENLLTMANFAARLYAEGQDYTLLFQAFEEIGLIDNVGILMPDNSIITKRGSIEAGETLDFEEEVKKGQRISGRVSDITDSGREVVRSAVPVISDGETVAILYGIIELTSLEERYAKSALSQGAHLLIIESGSGNFIVDTRRDVLGNVTGLASAEFQKGYSYEMLVQELTNQQSGYSAFRSAIMDEYHYAYYTDLEFSDWQILLAKPKSLVFAELKETGNHLAFIVVMILIVVMSFCAVIFYRERQKNKQNIMASGIRKRLLEFNMQSDSIIEALKSVVEYANGRTAVFSDSLGEDYCYINEKDESWRLSDSNRKKLLDMMFVYNARYAKSLGVNVRVHRIKCDKRIRKTQPEMYAFLKDNAIKSMIFALIISDNATAILGVLNPKKDSVGLLLKDIAVCFNMAVYNKKHLDKTENMALTDSLTAVANRMAYKQDIAQYAHGVPENLKCVYIDVNELHYFNNTFGHAAGDQMLLFIAETLKKEFPDEIVYRMGGDEFLFFSDKLSEQDIERRMSVVCAEIETMKYHISAGIASGSAYHTVEELVNAAEKNMYEQKSAYYQKKTNKHVIKEGNVIEHMDTHNEMLDAVLSVAGRRYHGLYSVSLKTDEARAIIMPAQFKEYAEKEAKFSILFAEYVRDSVKTDHRRQVQVFLQYDRLIQQIQNGTAPSVSYEKTDGERILLTVRPVADDCTQTLWIFEKEG